MPRIFFMSYARARSASPAEGRLVDASQALIDTFYSKLYDRIASSVKSDDNLVPGFRDIIDIKSGTNEWRTTLQENLADYPVGLVLLSPAYLNNDRPWCKWEFDFMHARNTHAFSLRLGDNFTPRLLLILDWIRPDPRDLPPNFPQEVQRIDESIARGDPEDLAAVRYILKRGLEDVVRMSNDGNSDAKNYFNTFIRLLSVEVIDQWRRWNDLGPSTKENFPKPSVFDGQGWIDAHVTSAGGKAKVRPDPSQRRIVYVVYVAAKPKEVPIGRKWRYQDNGEADWRPFGGKVFIGNETAAETFFESVSNVKVEKLPLVYFHEHMSELLEENKGKHPIIFIIDPWTATQLPSYQSMLCTYAEAKTFYASFGAPVVVWNENDAAINEIRLEFSKIDQYFGNTSEPVWQEEELRDCLPPLVNRLQRQIRAKLASDLPTSGNPPPRISPA